MARGPADYHVTIPTYKTSPMSLLSTSQPASRLSRKCELTFCPKKGTVGIRVTSVARKCESLDISSRVLCLNPFKRTLTSTHTKWSKSLSTSKPDLTSPAKSSKESASA